MKAVVLREVGSPEVLRLDEIETPKPGPGEVLLKVAGCGVCYHELLVRAGIFRHNVKLPTVMGNEVSGTVAEVGPGVSGFQVGDRVATLQYSYCGFCKNCRNGRGNLCLNKVIFGDAGVQGGNAEYMRLPATSVVKLPDGVALEDACILANTAGLALQGLREGNFQAGETVVVTGAGGGVGIHSVQVAKALGARVIAITTSRSKVAAIEAAGADTVIVSGENGFHEQVKELTGGDRADLVLDNVGTPVWHSTIRSVRNGGRIIFQGQVNGESFPLNPGLLILRTVALRAINSTAYQDLVDTLELTRQGKVRPIVDLRLPLAEAGRAHQMMNDRGVSGRVILVP